MKKMNEIKNSEVLEVFDNYPKLIRKNVTFLAAEDSGCYVSIK